MTEEWRPIPGWPGYEVSNLGRVISHKRRRPKLLSADVHPKGYVRVGLYDTGSGKLGPDVIAVHRLVMAAFVGPCPEGMEVCHNDGNPGNNALSNLRYDTHTANVRDSIKHGTHFGVHVRGKFTHCPQGHPYDETNTRVNAAGHRKCLTCYRQHTAAYRKRLRENHAAAS